MIYIHTNCIRIFKASKLHGTIFSLVKANKITYLT